jgi:hypothetical protein
MRREKIKLVEEQYYYTAGSGVNPVASAFPAACRGVSERMGNGIIPYGSKLLRRLLRRDSIKKSKGASDFSEPLLNDCLYPD